MNDDYEYLSFGPGDEFSVALSPDGEPAVLVRQQAFVEPDRWITFGTGFDDVRRMRELARTLDELASRAERSTH